MIKSIHVDTARTWRGGQNQVLLTVTGLEAIGQPAVLVAHEGGELRRRASEGLRYLGFSPRSEFDLRSAWQLVRIFDEIKPDVIHAHDPMAVSLSAMAMQMRPRNPEPLLVAARRVDFHLKRHAFSKWKYRQIDVFIAASRMIAQILVEDGIPPERIEVVHDGVNVSLVDKQPTVDAHAAFGLPHGAQLVGNVAALVAHKGQRHLIAAAARVVRELPDTRFLILGEGELREPLERQVRDLGLDRHVRLPGFRADALSLMKSFDVFAMSSLTEGLGSAVLEAMACARPVVGTLAGGLPEAIDAGETGRLVPPHDEPAMAAALIDLLRDADLRARLGAAGRARVEREFGIDQLVRGTLRVYEERLARRSANL